MKKIETTLASRSRRLFGTIIDIVISMLVIVPLMFLTGVHQQVLNGEGLPLEQHVAFFIIGWGVFLILNRHLLANRGQTIGKVAMKIKIVDLGGNIPSFGHLLFLRYLVLSVVAQMPVAGGIAAIVNVLFIFGKERRCLHDYLAGTKVVDNTDIKTLRRKSR